MRGDGDGPGARLAELRLEQLREEQFLACPARSGSRQARTTSAPRIAKIFAVSKPTPLFAPVMTAVRPSWGGTSAAVQRLACLHTSVLLSPHDSASVGTSGYNRDGCPVKLFGTTVPVVKMSGRERRADG